MKSQNPTNLFSEPTAWYKLLPLRHLVFLILAIIYSLSFIPRTFWGENEAYYALGGGNVLDGFVLMPVIYDQMFADKPPFMFWWVALVSMPFGMVTEFSARLANVLPAILCIVLIYRFGKSISPKLGLLSAVFLATAHEFYEVAFEVNTDIMLTAMLLASWIGIYRIMTTGFTWKLWAAVWIPMGIGLLTKGPVAPGLSCLVAVTFGFSHFGWRQGWSKLLSLRPFIGGTVCLFPFMLWCGAVYAKYGMQPLEVVLFKHNVQRFVAAFDHQKPWYYYSYMIFIIILPWSLFLPHTIIDAWKKKQTDAGLPPWQAFSWVVVIVLIVFFSLSSSKRGYYLLPIMPWLLLLIADAVLRVVGTRESNARIGSEKILAGSVYGAMLLVAIHIGIGYPLMGKHRSINALVDEIKATTEPTESLVLFDEEDPRIMFYLRESMTFYRDDPEGNTELQRFLRKGIPTDIISLKRKLGRLDEVSPMPLYIAGSAFYRKKKFYILTPDASKGYPSLKSKLSDIMQTVKPKDV